MLATVFVSTTGVLHELPHTRLFIAGTWQDAVDGKTIAVHNPPPAKKLAGWPASKADLDRALEAAQRALKPGATSPP